MLLHFRLYATLAVIGGAIVGVTGAGYAEWTEPVCHSELNDFENGFGGNQPCISSDGLSIFYRRQVLGIGYMLFEAWREEPTGPFTEERMLEELPTISISGMRQPWVSRDGLRLYFNEAMPEDGKWRQYSIIGTATRNSVTEQWERGRDLLELHVPKTTDSSPILTADELTIIWVASRPTPAADPRFFTATRASIEEPFSNEREIPELPVVGAFYPYLSGDGLRVYFTASRPDNGKNNIYMMTRPSLCEPFGNMEHLEGVSGPDAGANSPYLSPDEKTIYFGSGRGDTFYERGTWVSYWIDDPYDVAVESIAAAIAAKREAIAAITSGLDKDREVLEALDELGETGDIDPKYIEAARRYVLNAIKRQMRVIAELEKSIRELEKALEEL